MLGQKSVKFSVVKKVNIHVCVFILTKRSLFGHQSEDLDHNI